MAVLFLKIQISKALTNLLSELGGLWTAGRPLGNNPHEQWSATRTFAPCQRRRCQESRLGVFQPVAFRLDPESFLNPCRQGGFYHSQALQNPVLA